MPEQTFKITRAPEARAITTSQLKNLLSIYRADTEWGVEELTPIVISVFDLKLARRINIEERR